MQTLSLYEENEDAWQLYGIVGSQQDKGMGAYGPLRYEAVLGILDLYGVTNRREVFEKILLVHNVYLKKKSKETKAK